MREPIDKDNSRSRVSTLWEGPIKGTVRLLALGGVDTLVRGSIRVLPRHLIKIICKIYIAYRDLVKRFSKGIELAKRYYLLSIGT